MLIPPPATRSRKPRGFRTSRFGVMTGRCSVARANRARAGRRRWRQAGDWPPRNDARERRLTVTSAWGQKSVGDRRHSETPFLAGMLPPVHGLDSHHVCFGMLEARAEGGATVAMFGTLGWTAFAGFETSGTPRGTPPAACAHAVQPLSANLAWPLH